MKVTLLLRNINILIRTALTAKRQPHKMVKHTHTIPWVKADELLECVWPSCGVGV